MHNGLCARDEDRNESRVWRRRYCILTFNDKDFIGFMSVEFSTVSGSYWPKAGERR